MMWNEMNKSEVRHQVVSALLQADGPLTLSELLARCGLEEKDTLHVLEELTNKNLVVQGELVADKPAPQYRWRTRWEMQAQRRVVSSRQKLQDIVSPIALVEDHRLDIDSESVLAFHNYIINEYKPPEDKRFLAFLQCSVRRPFSSSPSHASMRRAISVATGYDPSEGFESCPVHVVVLASKIGPVPYELEGIYPASVRAGGVKHFSDTYYARVKPVLAKRMAQYIVAHRDSYQQITTFTHDRYGEVMEAAKKIAGVDFRVLPKMDAPRIVRMGTSIPRRYWEKYWIQLYLEIVGWLEPPQRAMAENRLKLLGVEYR
jgi:hypothetical protein